MSVERREYGTTSRGEPADLYVLDNGQGLTAEVTSFGARLVSLSAPDADGTAADVTLGYDDLAGWEADACYMGATVGRYANRIALGRFELDGESYQLACNDGENHLHGGTVGFDKVIWNADAGDGDGDPGVVFRYSSADNEEGYPGNLNVSVRYALTGENELRIVFEATTDQDTIVNLVNHAYWNLGGEPARGILDHELTLHAPEYLPVDAGAIPTGARAVVDGTPMDFQAPHRIGDRIAAVDGGYDHNWILADSVREISPAAFVVDPVSRRSMAVDTNQAGIQFYAGNFLDGSVTGKGGASYVRHAGLCLETQVWPDSPNHPGFPSCLLRPGDSYEHIVAHRFGVA